MADNPERSDGAGASVLPAATPPKTQHRTPSNIGLALGGGGARGLAHILVLEAFDELGVRPDVIVGTSIGAILGAAYCSGMSGGDIREYCISLFSNRTRVIRRILGDKNGKLFALWTPRRPAMFDPVVLLRALMPEQVDCDFDDLQLPLKVMATDFYRQSEFVIDSGEVMTGIAASAALPGLLKPVEVGGRILIDGGFVNPLPFDTLPETSAFTVAIDVSTGPEEGGTEMPSALEAVLGSTQITINSILTAKLQAGAPDLLIRPKVRQYRVLDFFKVDEILDDCQVIRDEVKQGLDTYLTRASA